MKWPKRSISPRTFTNDHLKAMPAPTRLLWVLLPCFADATGRITTSPATLADQLHLGTKDEVLASLATLATANLLTEETLDGQQTWQIHDYVKEQGKRPAARPVGHEDHHPTPLQKFVEFAGQSFQERFHGVMLPVVWGRDGKLLKPYLEQYDIETLKKAWKTFLTIRDPYLDRVGRSIPIFTQRLTALLTNQVSKAEPVISQREEMVDDVLERFLRESSSTVQEMSCPH